MKKLNQTGAFDHIIAIVAVAVLLMVVLVISLINKANEPKFPEFQAGFSYSDSDNRQSIKNTGLSVTKPGGWGLTNSVQADGVTFSVFNRATADSYELDPSQDLKLKTVNIPGIENSDRENLLLFADKELSGTYRKLSKLEMFGQEVDLVGLFDDAEDTNPLVVRLAICNEAEPCTEAIIHEDGGLFSAEISSVATPVGETGNIDDGTLGLSPFSMDAPDYETILQILSSIEKE